MGKQGLTRRDFLFQSAASLGAMAATPAWAQSVADERPGNKKVIHIIGYSHIDAAWLWPWRNGSDTVLTTFRSALNRINETPGFCYSHSSSAHYRWVERADPEMLSEIKQRIREGRWEVVGGWPVEPDCNIPSTESFVRHSLYGKAYCQSTLGAEVKIGFNPDSFGHAAGLPTILKRAGYGYYVFMRPQEHEMNLPLLFWWEGADGSRILTLRIWRTYDASPKLIQPAATGAFAPGFDHAAFFLGVGDHGGAVTKEQIQQVLALQQDASLPQLRFSTLRDFFLAVESSPAFAWFASGPKRVAAPCARLLFGLWRWEVPQPARRAMAGRRRDHLSCSQSQRKPRISGRSVCRGMVEGPRLPVPRHDGWNFALF